MSSEKTSLRKKYILVRQNIPEIKKIQYDNQIIDNLDNLLPAQKKVAIFNAKIHEINLNNLINLRPDIKFLFPRITHNKILDFHLIRNTHDFIYNKIYKLYEPDPTCFRFVPDIIICPMLSFDKYKHRLGYGGGYYDNTIAHLKQQYNLKTMGVAYEIQACKKLPNLDHDIVLDNIVTETTCY